MPPGGTIRISPGQSHALRVECGWPYSRFAENARLRLKNRRSLPSNEQFIEQGRHEIGVRHRQDGVDFHRQQADNRAIGISGHRSERPVKAMLGPGNLVQSGTDQGLDHAAALLVDADERSKRSDADRAPRHDAIAYAPSVASYWHALLSRTSSLVSLPVNTKSP